MNFLYLVVSMPFFILFLYIAIRVAVIAFYRSRNEALQLKQLNVWKDVKGEDTYNG